MSRRAIATLAIVVAILVGGSAAAEQDDTARQAFDRAMQQAVAGDAAAALAAFEALGAARPPTRWTDDAWLEAARLAERAGDLARARRDLDQAIALGTDPAIVDRARRLRERLTAITGAGRWDRVAAEHERLVADVHDGGDPRDALARLEQLVRANPGYPRATRARVAIARGWEQEGDRDRALAWMREAARGRERGRQVAVELVEMLIRDGALDEADAVLRELSADPATDRAALGRVADALATAEHRAWIRRGLWAVLGTLLIAALVTLRRSTGSWRAAGRALRRPPTEVLFLAPIAVVLVVVAANGNPLVARAVISIGIAGLAVAWLSGVVNDRARARGTFGAARCGLHAAVAVAAVLAATYLAIDHDRVLDLLRYTWNDGHALE